jgi:hypothetical protein
MMMKNEEVTGVFKWKNVKEIETGNYDMVKGTHKGMKIHFTDGKVLEVDGDLILNYFVHNEINNQ